MLEVLRSAMAQGRSCAVRRHRGFDLRWWCVGLILVSGLAVLGGCAGEPPARVVEVPKPRRMLVAMLLDEPREVAWFVKLEGPESLVSRHADRFQAFVDSITFDATTGEPKWEVPEGWTTLPSGQLQFAAFGLTPPIAAAKRTSDPTGYGNEASAVEGAAEAPVAAAGPVDDPQKVTVTRLSLPAGGDIEAYRLSNVNRWRGQLDLAPITEESLATLVTTQVAGLPTTWLDLAGREPDGAEKNAVGARTPVVPRQEGPAPTDSIPHQVPEGWKAAESRAMFSVLSLERTVDGKRATITVTPLTSASSWESNVERWIGQVQAAPMSSEAIQTATTMVTVDGIESERIDLRSVEPSSTPQRLIAVRVVMGETAWFIRMAGDPAVVEGELAAFDRFLSSLDLPE